jgi:hypothetical protein
VKPKDDRRLVTSPGMGAYTARGALRALGFFLFLLLIYAGLVLHTTVVDTFHSHIRKVASVRYQLSQQRLDDILGTIVGLNPTGKHLNETGNTVAHNISLDTVTVVKADQVEASRNDFQVEAARNGSLRRVEAAAAHNDSLRRIMATGREHDKSNSVRKHKVVKEAAAEAAAAAHNDSLSRVMVAGREYDKNNSDIVLGDPCANCRVDRVKNVLHNATGPQCMSVKCSHVFASSHYHRIYDCAVYYLQVVLSLTVLRHSQVTLLFDSRNLNGQMTIVSTLIDRLINPDHQLKTTLKLQRRGVCKFHLSDANAPRPRPNRIQSFSEYSCKRCFVQEMKQAATRKHGLPRQQGILFISRKSTRRITDEKVLVRRLTEIADSWGLPFRIYHGRENFLATVHLFLSSNIIVGYHGAGFINTVFCDRAHVIEITTFKYPTNNSKYPRRIWRSNKPGVSSWMTNSTLAWQILAVKHDRLVPRPPRDHPRGASFDWDHLVKETSVSLGRSNIKRITDMVEMTLKRQGAAGERTERNRHQTEEKVVRTQKRGSWLEQYQQFQHFWRNNRYDRHGFGYRRRTDRKEQAPDRREGRANTKRGSWHDLLWPKASKPGRRGIWWNRGVYGSSGPQGTRSRPRASPLARPSRKPPLLSIWSSPNPSFNRHGGQAVHNQKTKSKDQEQQKKVNAEFQIQKSSTQI